MKTRTLAVVVFALVVAVPAVARAQHYVLDAFGGVHAGGGAPLISPATPYFGFDAARAIAYRDIAPRVQGNATSSNVTLSSTAYTVLRSESIHAPDDGYILVVASAGAFCTSATGGVTAQFSLNVDGVGADPSLDFYDAGFADCAAVPPTSLSPSRWSRSSSCFRWRRAATRSTSSVVGPAGRRAPTPAFRDNRSPRFSSTRTGWAAPSACRGRAGR